MDKRKRYTLLLDECDSKPLSSSADDLDRYCELCTLCVDLSVENLQNMDRSWENTQMARVVLRYATYLEKFDHLADYLYSMLNNMVDCVQDHPRLKLQMLRLLLKVLVSIETQNMHDLSITDDVRNEISFYRRNIEFADKGELDQIRQSGFLKSDPIEWTAEWEEVIDEADKIAYENLKEIPRGMGFCFAFWHERTLALEKFGIKWKNPHIMNPRVMFD
ncbi:MAG: hypothetical protein ACI3ZG_02940 [Candidatus Coprenecus sp.]